MSLQDILVPNSFNLFCNTINGSSGPSPGPVGPTGATGLPGPIGLTVVGPTGPTGASGSTVMDVGLTGTSFTYLLNPSAFTSVSAGISDVLCSTIFESFNMGTFHLNYCFLQIDIRMSATGTAPAIVFANIANGHPFTNYLAANIATYHTMNWAAGSAGTSATSSNWNGATSYFFETQTLPPVGAVGGQNVVDTIVLIWTSST